VTVNEARKDRHRFEVDDLCPSRHGHVRPNGYYSISFNDDESVLYQLTCFDVKDVARLDGDRARLLRKRQTCKEWEHEK
jgi:hypothetical protein